MRNYRQMLEDIIYRRLKTPYTLHFRELKKAKRPRATVVLIHGIGSSTHMWEKVAEDLPNDLRVVAIDLLGFGLSPHPEWAVYDASTQAKSLLKTLLLHRVPLGSIFVGHSLGALVAVELSRRVGRYASALVLVSPPIYKPSRNKIVATQREDLLRGMYKVLQRYPKNTKRALLMAERYYIRRTGLQTMPGINIKTYLASLEASIINQSTIDHIGDVRPPITILSGSLDPLVIPRNLNRIAESSDRINRIVVRKAAHTIGGEMRRAVVRQVAEIVERRRR